jgi:hypothetical protein
VGEVKLWFRCADHDNWPGGEGGHYSTKSFLYLEVEPSPTHR